MFSIKEHIIDCSENQSILLSLTVEEPSALTALSRHPIILGKESGIFRVQTPPGISLNTSEHLPELVQQSRLILNCKDGYKFHIYIQNKSSGTNLQQNVLQIRTLESGDLEFTGSKVFKVLSEVKDKQVFFDNPYEIPDSFTTLCHQIFSTDLNETNLIDLHKSINDAHRIGKLLVGYLVDINLLDKVSHCLKELELLGVNVEKLRDKDISQSNNLFFKGLTGQAHFNNMKPLLESTYKFPMFPLCACKACKSTAVKVKKISLNPTTVKFNVQCQSCGRSLPLRLRSNNRLNSAYNWNLENDIALEEINVDPFGFKILSQVEAFTKIKAVNRLIEQINSSLKQFKDEPSSKVQESLKDVSYKVRYIELLVLLYKQALKIQKK